MSCAQNGERINFGRRSHAVCDAVAAPSDQTGQKREQTGTDGVGGLGSRTPRLWGKGAARRKPRSPAAEDGRQGAGGSRGHRTGRGLTSSHRDGARHCAGRGAVPCGRRGSPGRARTRCSGTKTPTITFQSQPGGSAPLPRPPPQTPCAPLPHTSVPSHACQCGGARTPNLWEEKIVPDCQTPMESANKTRKVLLARRPLRFRRQDKTDQTMGTLSLDRSR